MCTITDEPTLGKLFDYGTCLMSDSVIPVLAALAAVLFVWGAVKFFIINADEEAKRSQGKQFMIWGIIALVVISSVWGIVKIVGTTFGLESQTSVLPGTVPN